MEFTYQPRPEPIDRRQTSGRAQALRETLTNGQALVIPLDGVDFNVFRNRRRSGYQYLARRCNARLCSAPSADGLALLLWLEPKTERNDTGVT